MSTVEKHQPLDLDGAERRRTGAVRKVPKTVAWTGFVQEYVGAFLSKTGPKTYLNISTRSLILAGGTEDKKNERG